MTKLDELCERVKRKLVPAPPAAPVLTTASQAAVALILRQNREAVELLVIKRAIRAGDHWSGHLGLPGGRWQSEDADLLSTARRETLEEVGMNLLAGGGSVLGQLDTLKPRSQLIPQIDVTPYLFTAPAGFHVPVEGEPDLQGAALTLNHEVAAAFWVPIDYLKTEGLRESVLLMVEGEERRWPAYPSEHGPIWGLTERILTNFLELIE